MKQYLKIPAVLLFALSIGILPLSAGLIYRADFDDLSPGSPVELAFDGRNDTFSSANEQGLEAVVAETPSPEMQTGNALHLISHSAGNKSLAQSELVDDAKLLVVSLDRSGPSKSGISINAASRGTGRMHEALTPIRRSPGASRITMVVNKTGQPVTLPGGQFLEDGWVALYGKSPDGKYHSYNEQVLEPGAASGFSLLINEMSGPYKMYVDNIGVWDSLKDEVDGTSVLELDFGTLVPEGGRK